MVPTPTHKQMKKQLLSMEQFVVGKIPTRKMSAYEKKMMKKWKKMQKAGDDFYKKTNVDNLVLKCDNGVDDLVLDNKYDVDTAVRNESNLIQKRKEENLELNNNMDQDAMIDNDSEAEFI